MLGNFNSVVNNVQFCRAIKINPKDKIYKLDYESLVENRRKANIP